MSFKKQSQFAGILPDILRLIQSPPPDVRIFESSFPAIGQAKSFIPKFTIVPVPAAPPSGSNAEGYVTTADVNDNGIIDTINIVSPAIEKFFSSNKEYFDNKNIGEFKQLKGEKMAKFLNKISEIIVHEAGHLGKEKLKYDPKHPAGGLKDEGVAESLVLKPKKISKNKGDGMLKKSQAIQVLTKVAESLEDKEHFDLSDLVSGMINKIASSKKEVKKEANTQRADRLAKLASFAPASTSSKKPPFGRSNN